ncbi:MAG: hypothetical protein ACYCQI_10720 [Gammaproteobacteria bacterium]
MARKKGGGGKLNRSQIIQARLDTKLHMAAEIMARSERRTLSSFIERTIEQEAKIYKVKRNLFFPWWSSDPSLACADKIYSRYDLVTVEKSLQDIGTDHESIRFFKFASYFPELLNKEEEQMFSKIIFTRYFWMHYPVNTEDQNGNILHKGWVQVDAIAGLVRENLFEYWEQIKTNKISVELLEELPIGKKIPAPLRDDPRAIDKYIKTENSGQLKIVFAWNDQEGIEVSRDESFWKKHSKNLLTQKIQIKQTEEGPQIITTLVPPSNKEERKAWLDYYQTRMEELNNGDQI